MRIQYLLVVASVSALLAAPAGAQSTVKKVGDETHHVLKSTGRAVKEGAKDVGSATHHQLKKAGNGTKKVLGNATGIHKIGGDVGKAANAVSHTSKKIGRNAKAGVKDEKSEAHANLTRAGKDAKADAKKP
jgi:gas vesicle protein